MIMYKHAVSLGLLAAAVAAPANAQFVITRSTVDGGGATVAGGSYTLTGTIGQPEAGRVSGASDEAFGGFWGSTGACGGGDLTTTGSANGLPDGVIDLSDFSFYLNLWSSSDPRADITATGACLFSQGDGAVDLSDFSCYLTEWSQGCP